MVVCGQTWTPPHPFQKQKTHGPYVHTYLEKVGDVRVCPRPPHKASWPNNDKVKALGGSHAVRAHVCARGLGGLGVMR
jgi:hypothetical protein